MDWPRVQLACQHCDRAGPVRRGQLPACGYRPASTASVDKSDGLRTLAWYKRAAVGIAAVLLGHWMAGPLTRVRSPGGRLGPVVRTRARGCLAAALAPGGVVVVT